MYFLKEVSKTEMELLKAFLKAADEYDKRETEKIKQSKNTKEKSHSRQDI